GLHSAGPAARSAAIRSAAATGSAASAESGRVRRNVYQRARGLDSAEAADLVAAAERIAAEQAAAALKRITAEQDVHTCAVVVGAFRGAPLESILASHALAHAAEGRLYQEALLRGADACG